MPPVRGEKRHDFVQRTHERATRGEAEYGINAAPSLSEVAGHAESILLGKRHDADAMAHADAGIAEGEADLIVDCSHGIAAREAVRGCTHDFDVQAAGGEGGPVQIGERTGACAGVGRARTNRS